MRTLCPGRNASGEPQSTRKVRSRTSGDSGTEFTRVALSSDSGDSLVADATELISLKILLNQDLSGTGYERFRRVKQIRKQPEYSRNFMLPLRFHLYIWFPIACQKELVRKGVAQAQSSLLLMWRLLLIRDLT